MKKLVIGLLVVVVLLAGPIVINILQNGNHRPDGRSIKEILGVDPALATLEHINKLSKSDLMQLFYAAPCPKFSDMEGEYKAALVSVGVLAKVSAYYTHNIMGPGQWEGKAFTPATQDSGWGYNLFSVKKGEAAVIIRALKMDTFVGPSVFDLKNSFHLVYADYNKGLNHSMCDEIRKVNDKLFLGWGYMSWSCGKYNPAPFILYGKPGSWMGPDGED